MTAELIAWIAVFVGIIIIFGSMAFASFRAAPWLPLRKKDHARVLQYVNRTDGLFVDLGAGDGRMIADVVKHTGLRAVGYEISFLPYIAGLLRLALSKVTPKARMKFKDFFLEDLHAADVVYCFLTPPAMRKLKEKFERELRPGTRVISYSFEIKGWNATIVNREGTGIPVFIYDR